ncbi:MAG TPA: methyltransferase domain-containing protein [Stellaceae bacterium]|nr:methyltransferase domain-containing protein [Stellaceae bacterium]
MSDQAASFTGNIPENYDRGLGPVYFADFAAAMARQVAALAPSRVLETSAGTGIVTRCLRDLLPAATQLTATDLNSPMLDVARAKFGAAEKIAFQPADATALPFPDQAFDAVVCQFGVMFFPDKAKSYREAHRVLAPGGHYLFSVWDAHRHNPPGRVLHELLGELLPDDPPRFFEIPYAYCALDPIKEAVGEAGFTDFRVAVHRIEKLVADAAGFARGLIYGNPVFEQIRSRGADPDEILDALAAALHREFGPEPYRVPLQAILFEAMRR